VAQTTSEEIARGLTLKRLAQEFWLHRWSAGSQPDPHWFDSGYCFIQQTPAELSVMLTTRESAAPMIEGPWAGWEVEGPLDFSLTGIVATLTEFLAAEMVPVFVISSFDTDYLFVSGKLGNEAEAAWSAGGVSLC